MTSKWQKELGLSLLLALATLLAYGDLLAGGALPYSPYSDLVAQHLAMKQVAYQSLQLGQGLPLWKNDLLAGGPALTHPQALFTNPLQLLFLFLEPTAAAGPTIWLHFLAMALSFQALGIALGLGLWSQGFMALAGLFSFKLILITYSGWLPVLPGLVCTPLLFAAVLRVMDRPSLGAALLLTAAGSLGLHAGHLQIFYYATLFLAVYLAVSVAGWVRRGEARHAARVVSCCVLAAALAASSVAYLMLPLAAETDLTARAASNWEYFLGRGAYPALNLVTFLHPEALGTPLDGSYAEFELWEDVAYFGAVPEVLALIGALLGWRRRHVGFFVAAFAASIVLVFDSPILRVAFEVVPGFSLFRLPGRFLFLTTLLGIALAGVGVEELLARAPRWRAARRLPRLPEAVVALLILGVAAEGYGWSRRYVQTIPADRAVPHTRYAELLRQDPSAFRVAPIGRWTVNSGWASLMGLELVSGFDAYNYRHYRQYFDLMLGNRIVEEGQAVWMDLARVARWDLLDALNVKYVLTRAPLRAARKELELVARFEEEPVFAYYHGLGTAQIFVYRNPGARPRAYWAERLAFARDAAEALELVHRYDLGSVAFVEDSGGPGVPVEPGADGDIRVAERASGALVLETRRASCGFAVISEVWHPGWRATLDGDPIELHRTNVAVMGAWIPAGEHRLELRFQPLYWETGLALTLTGGAVFLGLCALWAARARRVSRRPPDGG